ncbi:MAG TPA: ribosome biogenesis GTP-binding protein YihA/YsxC [bacterium]|nr:ribosome biogenesis GTP-binding protein YihA/YsxC [bacterium]HPN45141.1 ribosome biogenesis GTP-binding protein YihA/YsxC [bacterium]
MKILSAEFIKSIADLKQLPHDRVPQIAFAGRSNVGKSSLLNSLLNRKKLVQVSSTPGKTRLINFFLINQKFYFVDLPGYGYARVARNISQAWQKLIENYFLQSPDLRGVIVLIDLRHDIMQADLELIDWLTFNQLPVIVVGTKADKLSGNQKNTRVQTNQDLLKTLGIQIFIPYSSITGLGKEPLWTAISELLSNSKA